MKGGKQPGSGRPKGVKNSKPRLPPNTRELVKAEFEKRVVAELQPLIDATMRASVGATVMVIRAGPTWVKARNQAQVLAALNSGGEGSAYIIQTEAPDAKLLNPIWDRIMGKPPQSLELPEGSGLSSVEVTYRIVASQPNG